MDRMPRDSEQRQILEEVDAFEGCYPLCGLGEARWCNIIARC